MQAFDENGGEAPLTRDDILSRVRVLLQSEFDVEAEQVSMGARFQEDLGLDSIDLVALATGLEQETGMLLKRDGLRGLRTIQDVVELVFALQVTGLPMSPLR